MLGIWERGILPGIATIDAIADDVRQDHLGFSIAHREIDTDAQRYAVINSKGFGGNNASATLLSPAATRQMLQARYSAQEWRAWEEANEAVRERQHSYDDGMIAGTIEPVYKFDHNVLHDEDVEFTGDAIAVGGRRVALDLESPFEDMKIS